MSEMIIVDKLFHALSDPTRRQIVQILSNEGRQSATMIYDRFEVSHPAISQHLSILHEAHVVNVEKKAKYRIYSVNQEAILEIENWTTSVKRMLEENFRALDEILKSEKPGKNNGEEKNGK